MIGRSLICAALLAVACNSTPLNAGSGELTSPTGIGVTGAADRDLVFIANTGRDGLRALQLCNHALLANGSVAPGDTCPQNQNGQFIPGPIRIFPASIETGDRPLRVAGARLQRVDANGKPVAAGVALAVGVDSTVAVVDARSLLDAQQNPGTSPRPIQHLDVGDLAIDVVVANPLNPTTVIEESAAVGAPLTAFVATRSELLVLDVSLDATGFAQLPTIRGRCKLAPVVPTRLAVIPGSAASVYVADGAGDGVVSVAAASIAGGAACAMDRISAGGRSVRSIALSPPWYETDASNKPVTHAAGELLLMVLEPLATPQPGMPLDPGGVVFARTGIGLGTKGIVPIPPFALDAAGEPMQPLSLPGSGLLREAAFLRAVPPLSTAAPDFTTCAAAPCTPLYVGQPTNAPVHLYSLLAAVTATDGATYFVEVPARRFVNVNLFLDALAPTMTQTPSLNPSTSSPPVLTVDVNTFQPGVTRSTTWRAVFHSALPGFGVRAGTLTHTNQGTLLLTLPGTNLQTWRADPSILLAVGDVVSFGTFALSTDTSPTCQAVISSETAFRFELQILSIPSANTVELQVLAPSPDGLTRGFNAAGCSALGVTAEIRTGGTQPWLLFESDTAKGRLPTSGSFTARQRRFDYPLATYDPNAPPLASKDTAFTFTLTPGTVDPPAKAAFTWIIDSRQSPSLFADVTSAGLATAVQAYSSLRQPNLVFSSITGSNEVLQANPAVLGSQVGGLIPYR